MQNRLVGLGFEVWAGTVALLDLHPGLRRIVPVAMRHWRHRPFVASTWREVAAFRHALRRDEYAAVLDLQEQVKGALIARMARGVRHGPDRASIREPLATLAARRAPRDRSRPAFHRALPRARRRRARLSRRRPAAIRARRAAAAAGVDSAIGRSSSSFTARRARTSCGPTRTGGAWSKPSRRPAIRSCCRGEATTSARGASATPPASPTRTCRRRRGYRCRARGASRARRARRRRRHGPRASRRRARHADRIALRRDRPDALRRRSRGSHRRATSGGIGAVPDARGGRARGRRTDATRAALLMDSDARDSIRCCGSVALPLAPLRLGGAAAASPAIASTSASVSAAIAARRAAAESSGCTRFRSARRAPPRRSSSACAARIPTRRCC